MFGQRVGRRRSPKMLVMCAITAATLVGFGGRAADAIPEQDSAESPTESPLGAPTAPTADEGVTEEAQALVALAEEDPGALDDVPTRRLIVTVADGESDTELSAIAGELDAVSVHDLGDGSAAVEVKDPMSASEAAQALESAGDVASDVEIDMPVLPSAVNDPYMGSLWGLTPVSSFGIDPYPAWGYTTGAGVTVAVVDTGVDIYHPDLRNNIWVNADEVPGNGIDDDRNGYTDDRNGYDFYSDDASVFDSMNADAHGTHVSGTIAAVTGNGYGVAGVAHNAKIMPLKFISGVGYTSDAVRAINYAVANGAGVINASWGGGGYSSSLRNAIDTAGSRGVVFVAAAGNNAANVDATPYYPAAYTSTSLIAVAAMTSSGVRASFSNYGATSVDIAAPGEGILSTVPGGFAYYSGTSMAAPHVSGIAALVKSFKPSDTAAQIRSAILAGAAPNGSFAGLVATGGMANAPGSLRWLPPYWFGWDIARGVAIASNGVGGYTFDGWGGIHPWHDAPAVSSYNAPYWKGWAIARDVVILDAGGGATLDGWGGVHVWGGASLNRSGAPYWTGVDIARGMSLDPDGPGGWLVDGWGGIHPFGGAPSVTGGPYWPGVDIARDIVKNPNGPGGWLLDGWGGIHPFGGAPRAAGGPYWPGWDIARGMDISPDGKRLYIIDGWGGIHQASLP